MSLDRRVRRLEGCAVGASLGDRELYARCDPVAREHDVSLDELVEETKQILGMTPAARDHYVAELRAAYERDGEAMPACLR